jgi:UDP-N-acetylglucosamine--N-acetylmuramyl-(pentapeptide) pyrophosphoryl-undecaprenol N-acetylglucosamine transferase
MDNTHVQLQGKVAIACGGTGGHLYPGVAIAEALKKRGIEVALLVSNKAIDQEATEHLRDKFTVRSFPSVGLAGRNYLKFFKGLMQSRRESIRFFKEWNPQTALAMGGFTSAGPILAARSIRIPNGIHEANVIPGRANRWLARGSDFVFLNFEATRNRLKVGSKTHVMVCGLPVRSSFFSANPALAKSSFGWNPDDQVLLVTGGSQGAGFLNDQILSFRSRHWSKFANWKLLHLTGPSDFDRMKEAYRSKGFEGIDSIKLCPFLHSMENALASANVCVTRSGASFLGELEVFKSPALLVPYPHAVENHQYWNAVAYSERSVATIFEETRGGPAEFASALEKMLLEAPSSRPSPMPTESKAAQLVARYLEAEVSTVSKSD